jgi:hypothetical protein
MLGGLLDFSLFRFVFFWLGIFLASQAEEKA